MQTPAPFEYDRAASVDDALGAARAPRTRGPAHRRRPQPAADDEAAPGAARGPRRHQRPDRPVVHPGRGRRDRHRRHDPPRATCWRRPCWASTTPSSPTPSASSPTRWCATGAPSAGRSARPTRPRTSPPSPPRCDAEIVRRSVVGTRRCRPASSTTARTRPWSGRRRSSPRCGCRSGPARAARTRRSSGGSVTGRWRPPGPFVTLDGDIVADVGIGLTAVGRPALLRPGGRGRAARPGRHRREHGRRGRRPRAEGCTPPPTSAARSDYKRHLAEELTLRALRRAVGARHEEEADHAGHDDRQRRAR